MSTAPVVLPLSVLSKAIVASDVTLIKSMVIQMCQSSNEVATTVSEYLLVQKGESTSDSTGRGIGQKVDGQAGGDGAIGTNVKAEDNDSGVVTSLQKRKHDNFVENESDGDGDEDESEFESESEELKPKRIRRSTVYAGPDAELISRYETCLTCKKRFDILANHPQACKTHSGTLDVDYNEFGEDPDVEDGYEIDPHNDWRRDEFPEAFTWTCCGGIGNAKPCRWSRHTNVQPAAYSTGYSYSRLGPSL